jgi:uncharacterized membrane protein YkvA (DUF1232 family)
MKLSPSLKAFLKENWMLIAAVLYILFPVDFIPDFLPALGLSDDLGALLLAIVVRYWQHTRSFNKPKKTDSVKGEKVDGEGPIKRKSKIVDGELVE